jgi:hypothetical protein
MKEKVRFLGLDAMSSLPGVAVGTSCGRTLTKVTHTIDCRGAREGFTDASFSPDGKWVVFANIEKEEKAAIPSW